MKSSINFITPSLVFSSQAEEAAKFYVSVFSQVFEDSRIIAVSRFTEAEIAYLASIMSEGELPGKAGDVYIVKFRLNGQDFVAGNGGSYFTFSQAMSLFVKCETQKQIDTLWEGLSVGGEKQACGWLVDRFGVSWQIASADVESLFFDPNPRKAEAAILALFSMEKYDLAALAEAHAKGGITP